MDLALPSSSLDESPPFLGTDVLQDNAEAAILFASWVLGGIKVDI